MEAGADSQLAYCWGGGVMRMLSGLTAQQAPCSIDGHCDEATARPPIKQLGGAQQDTNLYSIRRNRDMKLYEIRVVIHWVYASLEESCYRVTAV